jgi:hypothetical protein
MIASKWRNLLVRELPLLCVAVATSKFGAGPDPALSRPLGEAKELSETITLMGTDDGTVNGHTPTLNQTMSAQVVFFQLTPGSCGWLRSAIMAPTLLDDAVTNLCDSTGQPVSDTWVAHGNATLNCTLQLLTSNTYQLAITTFVDGTRHTLPELADNCPLFFKRL